MHSGFGNRNLRFSNENSGEKDELTATFATSTTSADSTTSTTTFDLSTVIYNHGYSPARLLACSLP